MNAWDLLAWTAVPVGLWATWLSSKHPTGWIIGLICCLAWIGYDTALHLWAALTSATIGAAISLRNYRTTRQGAPTC